MRPFHLTAFESVALEIKPLKPAGEYKTRAPSVLGDFSNFGDEGIISDEEGAWR